MLKNTKTPLFNLEKAEKIFIGDASIASMRHIVNSLEPDETIVIDEGSKVFFNYKKHIVQLENDKSFSIDRNSLQHFLATRLFGYRIQNLQRISFFSAWDLTLNNKVLVYKNDFQYLKKRLTQLERTEKVYFLGAPLVDHKRFDTEVYYEYLQKIKKYFSNQPILYIPHRDETEKHLNKVKSVTGFEVADFDLPIEYKICMEGPVPYFLAGFLSSALQTCDTIFDGYVDVISFYIENRYFQWQNHEYEEQYNYLKSRQSASFKVITPPELIHD